MYIDSIIIFSLKKILSKKININLLFFQKYIMNNITKFIISIWTPVIIWAIAWFATSSSIDNWYILLEKPFFNPPNWIFWPVWTILYVLIWVSFFLIWKKDFWKNKKLVWIIYALQLLLNFLWSFSFFYFQNPLLWGINIILLLILIVVNIFIFYKIDKTAGLLLIPYLLWVWFATLLNFSIILLNT